MSARGAKTTAARVAVVGRGRVGSALAAGFRAAGWRVHTVAGRNGHLARGRYDLLVLAVPDGAISATAERLVARLERGRVRAAVHCAGAVGFQALAPFASLGVPCAQLHPLLSFADPRRSPLGGTPAGHALVQGEPAATRVATRAARALGLVPIRGPVDPLLYHAAAAVLANGGVAVADLARALLGAAGVDPGQAAPALGALLASVARNIAELGPTAALTGPIRRGDADTVARHLAAIAERAAHGLPLVLELARAQLAMARRAPTQNYAAVERRIAQAAAGAPKTPKSRRKK
jgi:predicted short-subunit dehydrogenase-like oxidoreductase (DUF2520 family)